MIESVHEFPKQKVTPYRVAMDLSPSAFVVAIFESRGCGPLPAIGKYIDFNQVALTNLFGKEIIVDVLNSEQFEKGEIVLVYCPATEE